MPELTDDQLDGLFRKSVEEFDTPFDPAAWQDMNSRLDANDRTTPSGALAWKNLIRWGLPVALLLLLTGGGWFVYHKVNSEPTATPQQKAASTGSELTKTAKGIHQSETPRLADTEQPDIKPASSPELKGSEVGQSADRAELTSKAGNSESKVDEPIINLTEKALSTGNEGTERVGSEASRAKPLTKPSVGGATKSVTSSYRLTSGKTRTNRSRVGVAPVVTDNEAIMASNHSSLSSKTNIKVSMSGRRKQRNDKPTSVHFSTAGYAVSSTPAFSKRPVKNDPEVTLSEGPSTASNVVLTESSEVTPVALPTINELASKPAHWPKALAFTGRPVEAQPDTTAQRVTPKLPPMRGLSIRFVVSPDLSSVGLKNFSRPGTNIGLLLEYRLAARWSIQAGVIKSTKVYKALPSEYDAPTTWWQYPMKSPDLVDGRCNMFDIPINIRYDVLVKPRLDGRLPSRWFVSGGVTSYIMRQEDYTYTYPAHTYNQPTEWSTSTGGYGFSNLNLSVGYEQSISRRLSWQVEPFMKAPLKGVGFFKVNLLSTGAFFSLRYKL